MQYVFTETTVMDSGLSVDCPTAGNSLGCRTVTFSLATKRDNNYLTAVNTKPTFKYKYEILISGL